LGGLKILRRAGMFGCHDYDILQKRIFIIEPQTILLGFSGFARCRSGNGNFGHGRIGKEYLPRDESPHGDGGNDEHVCRDT
jgi:hypothetical protein